MKQPKDSLEADIGQLRAVENGRTAGVPWQHFGEALCVSQGAYRMARRLKTEQVREPDERHAPEIAREHEVRGAAEQREWALMLVQERRFPVAQQISRLYLEHRDGIILHSWATYRLGEIAETIDDPAEHARFTLHHYRGGPTDLHRVLHGQLTVEPSMASGRRDGSFRTDSGRSPGLCCRRRGCGRRAEGWPTFN